MSRNPRPIRPSQISPHGFEPDLKHLLAPAGETGTIGPERSGKMIPNGIVRFVSPQGSYRYVYFLKSVPIAGLQIMRALRTERRWIGIVAQVYTAPAFRRQGYAMRLMDRAQKDFDEIRPAKDLSSSGASWQSAWRLRFDR